MDITLNYFELFQLPVSCDLNTSQLAIRYRELQRTVHPDRFAGDADRQQRLSLQYAAYVNEAYTVLKSPLTRYIYLLKLAGREVDMAHNTIMDSAFLAEQMALRESVAEVQNQPQPEAALQQLVEHVDESLDTLGQRFSELWTQGSTQALEQAEVVIRKMQFLVKVADELDQMEAELFH